MRAATWWKAWLTTSALAALSGSAHAQGISMEALRAECDPVAFRARPASSLGADAVRTPSAAFARLGALVTLANYSELGDSVVAYWTAFRVGTDPAIAQAMQRRIDALRDELRRADTDAAFRTREGATPNRFDVTEGDGDEFLVEASAGGDALRLVASATDVRTARAVCWSARLAEAVANVATTEARGTTRAALAARAARWDAFETTGYSLAPLELLVNGWCGICREALDPPRTQIIALHMLPAFVVRDSVGGRAALTTEVAGLLRYSESRADYWGLSAVVAFPSEEGRESGLLLHWSKVGQLGLTFRRDTWTRRNASLLVSADLYAFLEQWRGRLVEERDRVRAGAARLGLR